MPQKTLYIAEVDLPTYDAAEERAKAEGRSLSAVVADLLREYASADSTGATQLYWTDALPTHYVAIKPDGSRWLIACAPMGPEVWGLAKPYNGNYLLERVCPTAIERYYQPQ